MRTNDWQEDEMLIVSVSPIPFGLVGPVLSFAAIASLLVAGYQSVGFIRQHVLPIGLIVLGPTLLLVATRTWRWRSHRVLVTSHRVQILSGTIKRHRDSVYFEYLVGVHTQKRVRDRLARRGGVTLETHQGPVHLGYFRHPDSLVRVIQHQRDAYSRDSIPLDTTFDFEMPTPFTPRVVRRRSHRQGDHE